ncbi:Bacteriophage protein [Klebsiella variicola subsp. variicola]
MNNRKILFGVTATDVIVRDDYNNAVVNDLMSHLTGIRRIVMTCYRAGGALTELIIDFGEGQTFCLTIGEGSLDIPPFTSDDIRLIHKQISLPDVTDIIILVTTLARYAGLSPSFSGDGESSALLEFSS